MFRKYYTMFSVLWITVTILSYCSAETGQIQSSSVEIDGCEYRIFLSPTRSCHDNTEQRSRSKRSTVLHQEESQVKSAMESLSEDFKRLEKNLKKEMHKLSTRVLRGTRRLESITDDETDRKKKRCADGFVGHTDWESCYLFSTFNTSWYTAREFCRAMDSDLLAVSSQREHFLVTFMIKHNPEYSHHKGWWTSGTYVSKTKQWMWTSSTEMEPFTYIKWAVNEPNEKHDQELQCMMMYELDDLNWHDQICTDKYNFVCEKKLK